jgi:hypothetical protein
MKNVWMLLHGARISAEPSAREVLPRRPRLRLVESKAVSSERATV